MIALQIINLTFAFACFLIARNIPFGEMGEKVAKTIMFAISVCLMIDTYLIGARF